VILFPVSGATYCRFPLPVCFVKTDRRAEKLENGESSTRKFYRTPIANRGRPFEWSSYFRFAASPSGKFRFRSVFATDENRELLENGGSWTRNVCRTPIANQGRSIEWSSYLRHAALLAPRSVLWRFPLPVCTKVANNSRMLATGQEMYTEHQ
jgi:hypothetical protein